MLFQELLSSQQVVFIDAEVNPKSQEVLDIGAVKGDGSVFHQASLSQFETFVANAQFICGHNILSHDLVYLKSVFDKKEKTSYHVIDTLHWSPLLFPDKPYHRLVKDDKLQQDDRSNPVNDCKKAQALLWDECETFLRLDPALQRIYYGLLYREPAFKGFFKLLGFQATTEQLGNQIADYFQGKICGNVDWFDLISFTPVELAFAMALVNGLQQNGKSDSLTPMWVMHTYPKVEHIMRLLRSQPCKLGCVYCTTQLNAKQALKRYFGYDQFRTYAGQHLQENAVEAALQNDSLLAIFPTGGGKSITFQIPALVQAESMKGLTVVISPLQSLMKDQVDNLERMGITQAVTINGLLDPIERSKSIDRILDGSASILYISPESLRSKTIERCVASRKIARFVIDEAHCFSAWGHDFRVDYLYVGDFIRNLQEKKGLLDPIPVSCFTATAKQNVIQDIQAYFKAKLQLDLSLFTSTASRENLLYRVVNRADDEEKYQAVRELLEEYQCPSIIYVSRTRKASELALRLSQDGFTAKPFHGKMDTQEKIQYQNAFIAGEVSIMVATSAFGMGVDKKDVGLVIHHDISDSLENYVQEAGRAGRDESIRASCYVLFNEEDLAKHFLLLNQTKLSIKEIQQIWRAIKDLTRFRKKITQSALEIARKAGWDDQVRDIETRVKSAISALEEAGYLKRGQNSPRIFATGIQVQSAQEAIDRIMASPLFSEQEQQNAIRIIKSLFSSKNRKETEAELAESRVDYLSDRLGIKRDDVIQCITQLREEKILADSRDLSIYVKSNEQKNKPLRTVKQFIELELFLLAYLADYEIILHLKEINEAAEQKGISSCSVSAIKTVLNYWSIKGWLHKKPTESKNHLRIQALLNPKAMEQQIHRRHDIARFIVEWVFEQIALKSAKANAKEEVLLTCSVLKLKNQFNASQTLFNEPVTIEAIEDALFFLTRTEVLKIEGGFLVVYNRLLIERKEKNNKKQFTKEDYSTLQQFYASKVEQIHIVGEYANRMIKDYKNALEFVNDYFQLTYETFLTKYFDKKRQKEIRRTISPAQFTRLFGELSPTQLAIINDNESAQILVAAGPGSGKTRVLVHKLASLLWLEDVRHEQLLMLTFSRAAATEFKTRLIDLIGNSALYVEIKTYHSYCFDLLGKVGTLDQDLDILEAATAKIINREVEFNRITKSVLVIDEAQDMNQKEWELVFALMQFNEEMRVIIVGDDDQIIYEFRGADIKWLAQFQKENGVKTYDLFTNYRSKPNLVALSNSLIQQVSNRLKSTSIEAHQQELGDLHWTRLHSEHFITPLLNALEAKKDLRDVCVLTRKNEHALQIVGGLTARGVAAQLIQSNDTFQLTSLYELRYFTEALQLVPHEHCITDEKWEHAKKRTYETFALSNKLPIVERVIDQFEILHPQRKFTSDWTVFLKESRLEEFYRKRADTITVSTIHKAKGKEFDTVFLYIPNNAFRSDADLRLLYVGLTRAKSNVYLFSHAAHALPIHLPTPFITEDFQVYPPAEVITLQLGHRDIFLSFFADKQAEIKALYAGQSLQVKPHSITDHNGIEVLRFSQRFKDQLAELATKGYTLTAVTIHFLVHWFDEKQQRELLIILPEVVFSHQPS